VDPSDLVDGVLRSVLGGRRKRSHRAVRFLGRGSRSVGRAAMTHPTALLTLAGLAWGIFESLQNPSAAAPPPATGGSPASPFPGSAGSGSTPPLPSLGGEARTPGQIDDATRLIRLAVSAAQADGAMNEQERAAILEHAREAGVEPIVAAELGQTRPVVEIVAGVSDPAARATLYGLAFTVVRADEQVNGAERIYLASLAHLLGLDPPTVRTVEQGLETRIDAAEA